MKRFFNFKFFSSRRSLDEKKSSIELKGGEEWAMKWKSKLDIFDCYFFELKRTQRDFSKYLLLLLLDSSKHTKNYLLKKKVLNSPFPSHLSSFCSQKVWTILSKTAAAAKAHYFNTEKTSTLICFVRSLRYNYGIKKFGFCNFFNIY